MLAGTLAIAEEDPRSTEARALIAALDAYLNGLYPPDNNYLIDPEAMAGEGLALYVAREGGRAVGCAALRPDPEGYGELKRMFVVPAARGRGIGRALLAAVEQAARDRGYDFLRLETGNRQAEAIALYRAAGYRECGPFSDYRCACGGFSLFMEKPLRGAGSGTAA